MHFFLQWQINKYRSCFNIFSVRFWSITKNCFQNIDINCSILGAIELPETHSLVICHLSSVIFHLSSVICHLSLSLSLSLYHHHKHDQSSPIPAYSSLFQPIPANSSLFQPIPSYSNLFQPIPTFSNLFQPMVAYSTYSCINLAFFSMSLYLNHTTTLLHQ